MIKVGIGGALGRMGVQLVRLVNEHPDMQLAAAIEGPDCPALGKDVGVALGMGELGVPVTSEIPTDLDVVIDFSSPQGTAQQLMFCPAHNIALVIGTTGIDELRPRMERAAETIPVLASPNMSVGVNLVFKIAAQIAQSLGPDYDIEIVEAHHRFKKDAPSGTALKIAEEIAKATNRTMSNAVYGRQGQVGERKAEEIGIHAVRCGDIVGDHTIMYSTLGEQIELKHSAHSRETFARGAVRAAKAIVGMKPGLYTMADVL